MTQMFKRGAAQGRKKMPQFSGGSPNVKGNTGRQQGTMLLLLGGGKKEGNCEPQLVHAN